jgi:hypothetical protein
MTPPREIGILAHCRHKAAAPARRQRDIRGDAQAPAADRRPRGQAFPGRPHFMVA